MVQACPSLVCFFNKGTIEGTNSLTICVLMFVYKCMFCLVFVCGQILWI